MILGSSSANFALDSERHIYTLCGNSLVITSVDGTSSEWQPDQGLYEITSIAIAPNSGVICLSKKSISVTLLFFRVSKLRKIGEIPSIAEVEVQQLVYSQDETVLLVLCNYPSSAVKILNSSGTNGMFSISKTINLPDTFFSGLLFVKLRNAGCDVIVWGEHSILAYTLKESETDYTQCASHECIDDTITCGCVVPEGELFGFASGKVCFFNQIGETLSAVVFCRSSVSYLAVDNSSNSIFLCQVDGLLLRLSGSAPNYQISPCCQLPSIGQHMSIFLLAQSTSSVSELVVSTGLGVYRCIEEENNWIIFPIREKWWKTIKKCHALKDGEGIVCVSGDGTISTFFIDRNEVCEWNEPAQKDGKGEIVDSCISLTGKLVLVSREGIFYKDPLNGNNLDHAPILSTEEAYLRCAVNDSGTLVYFTPEIVYFFDCTETSLCPCGSLNLNSFNFPLAAKFICGLPGENAFLVACSNGEIFLISVSPSPTLSVDAEDPFEGRLKGSWRLDFPVEAMHPCHVSDEAINILVHSIDKDTKVYALYRRNEEKDTVKVLRPIYLMRDHSSGGRCLCPVGSTVVCSGGKDGCLVWRDIGAYQKRLPAMPPSKEKRKPLRELTVWHFVGGGVISICVVGDMIACVGSQASFLKIIPGAMPITFSVTNTWKEPQWISRRTGWDEYGVCSPDASMVTQKDVEMKSQTEEEGIKKTIQDELNEIQQEWCDVVQPEWFDRVSAESLLPPSLREQFEAACVDAVYKSRETEYYQLLENEYTQDVIRARCCEPMEVVRSKIVSIYGGLEVHNFHIAKIVRPHKKLAEKCVFLRSLQRKASQASRTVNICENASLKAQLDRNVLLISQKGFVSALYSPFEAFTEGRAVLQTILLKGVMLSLKDSFNQRYDEIRQVKKSILSAIEDKTRQCLQIVKQLGEEPCHDELFSPYIDYEEDPGTVFTVRDEELDEKVRRLLPPKQESCIVSPSNEAALKLWMDGLEKDVEHLQVNVPLPSFADESCNAFVPKDERTEEQLQLMEQYETQLREETEAVNARKDELRNEFKRLQTECRTLATDFDMKLSELRSLRAATAKTLHEIELELVLLLQHRLKFFDTLKKFDALQEKITSLFQQMEKLTLSIEAKQRVVASMRSSIYDMEERQKTFLSDVRNCEPFVDELHGERLYRRFVRWKRLFDAGKSDLPLDNRPPDGIPLELWTAFCDCSREVLQLRVQIQESQVPYQQEVESLNALQKELETLDSSSHALEAERDHLPLDLLDIFLNTRCLYHLHQGQIQDEKAALTSDFNTSHLRWVSDVDQYNQAIFASAEKSDQLLSKIVKKKQLNKQRRFEATRLDYCTGTFKLELQQLHTLRVTRLMQEWLCGDADVSEEKAIAKISEHIQLVNLSMARKMDQLNLTAKLLKRQIAERVTENSFVDTEREKIRCTVQDANTVKIMTDAHRNVSSQIATRAKEIFQTSEMEEVARSQQEELVRLKNEVDRLRAKTFPSFATVCKRI
ncbi:unnamed protein product [Phytomonas sp. EM1]|nr:unnamed protein product [Phytomonas sp. EM1]|eukprot:CCW65718.1 unnamed protein product [Phytomonas sp. isolate EM1]